MLLSSKFVLASASPYKRALLSRLGFTFGAQDAAIDESRRPDESPLSMALRLAQEKARVVAEKAPDFFVLGADQTIALGDRIFSKPGTRSNAIHQLIALQGQTHQLINAICLYRPQGPPLTDTVIYEMVMRPLSRDQIEAYVDEDTPLQCAGSYRIEAAGIRLFSATRGDDPSAIEGLPLTRVWTLLEKAGAFDD